MTADEWDEYNQKIRAILEQFKIDFETYRFAVEDNGINVSVNLKDRQKKPEYAFIRTLLQISAVLPNVPEITLSFTQGNLNLLVEKITAEQLQTAVSIFTNQSFDQLFVINKNNPVGKMTAKTDNPDHTYVGDLVFQNDGEYNPYPFLANLNAKLNNDQLLWTYEYSLVHPSGWFYKDRSETIGDPYQIGDLLFYNSQTTFLSESSWEGFAVDLRTYSVPDIHLSDWLFVNRNDRIIEDLAFETREHIEAKEIKFDNSFQKEYVLKYGNDIYVINIEHAPELSEDELKAIQNLVKYFSDHSIINKE